MREEGGGRLTHREGSRLAGEQQQTRRGWADGSPPPPSHLPSYGRSFPPLHSSSSDPSDSSPFAAHRNADQLEAQNDDAFDALSAKVRLLKDISLNIGAEVQHSSSLIASLNDSFSEATGVLAGTIGRMDRMGQRQYGRWWYWFLFLVVVFWVFVFTWLWRR